jgi:hypothetical protein
MKIFALLIPALCFTNLFVEKSTDENAMAKSSVIECYVCDEFVHLQISSVDNSHDSQWGCYDSKIYLSGPESDAKRIISECNGMYNTKLLTDDCSDSVFAAKVCANLTAEGHDDWYLPSVAELDCIFQHKDKIGGFNSAVYWSSSEHPIGFSWFQNFAEKGFKYQAPRNTTAAVRCVRKP